MDGFVFVCDGPMDPGCTNGCRCEAAPPGQGFEYWCVCGYEEPPNDADVVDAWNPIMDDGARKDVVDESVNMDAGRDDSRDTRPDLDDREVLADTGEATCNVDDHEPNEKLTEASYLFSGIPEDGAICPVGDLDYFQFVLLGVSDVVLNTSGVTGDTVLRLFDASGLMIAGDDNGGQGQFSRIERPSLPAGTYHALVEAPRGGTVDGYRLELTATVVCTPLCDSRDCGDDFCGGSCGQCAQGTVCDPIMGLCTEKCNWATDKPTSWGPAGVVSMLQTPADKATAGVVCFDFTGDGIGDSGLVGLAGQLNGPLLDVIEGGELGFIKEFKDVKSFYNNSSFVLGSLTGTSAVDPPTVGGNYLVSPDGYVQETCLPLIQFRNARITVKKLIAGPETHRLSIPIDDDLVAITLLETQVRGTIIEGDADGVALTDGVLSGVITKAEMEAVLAGMEAKCDAAPVGERPGFCDYLSVAKSAMALLFDLHQQEDGTYIPKSAQAPGNAASVCMTFELAKAKIVGFGE